LQVELEAGRIGGQEEAQRYLAETWGGPVRDRQRHLILVQAAQSEVEDRTPSPCQGRCCSARGLFANFAATLKELAK
jgi:hypothetical protein